MTPTPSNPTVEPRTPSSRGVPNPSFRLNGDRGAPTTTTPGGEREYVVKEGDTFVGIAEAEYGDQKYWTTIESANPGVDPRTLKVGQKLKLPAKPAPTTTPAATPTTPRESASSRVTPAQPTPADSGRYHVIAEGDTLAEIAEQYYGEQTYWPQLLKANPDVDPARLLVGNKLRLPDKEQFTRKETRPTPADQPRSGASRVEPSSSDAPEYIVESGDSLIGIARKVLGDGERWNEIFELNKDRLDSADDIRVGMKLRVPRPARTGSTSRR